MAAIVSSRLPRRVAGEVQQVRADTGDAVAAVDVAASRSSDRPDGLAGPLPQRRRGRRSPATAASASTTSPLSHP